VRGEAGDWRSALPKGRADRVLFGIGAAALLLVVPLLWILLVYGRALAGADLWVAGIVLSGLTAGIGAALLRMLDDGR
jgi:hypothetical protein